GFYLAKRDSGVGQAGWHIRAESTGAVQGRLSGPSSSNLSATSAGVYNDGKWHSYAVIFSTSTTVSSSNTVEQYIDGVLDPAMATGTTELYAACTTCEMRLGTDQVSGGSFLAGAMDDVRFYTRPLSRVEILAYHRKFPPDLGGMVREPL